MTEALYPETAERPHCSSQNHMCVLDPSNATRTWPGASQEKRVTHQIPFLMTPSWEPRRRRGGVCAEASCADVPGGRSRAKQQISAHRQGGTGQTFSLGEWRGSAPLGCPLTSSSASRPGLPPNHVPSTKVICCLGHQWGQVVLLTFHSWRMESSCIL